MNSPLLEKSMDFATQIVLFYEEFSKSKKDTTIAKQLLRSATSVGANINEAIYRACRRMFESFGYDFGHSIINIFSIG